MLLIPRFSAWGAAITLSTMLGAIAAQLYLGLFDALFIMAVVTAAASAILVWMYRHQLPILKELGAKN